MNRMVTGSFNCSCSGTAGSCSVVITPNMIFCESQGCTKGCYMQ
jgi:hypothetical protein